MHNRTRFSHLQAVLSTWMSIVLATSLWPATPVLADEDGVATSTPTEEITEVEAPLNSAEPAQEPDAQEPDTKEPDAQEPASQEPATQEPTSQEPNTQEPAAQEPHAQESSTKGTDAQEPTQKEPDTANKGTNDLPANSQANQAKKNPIQAKVEAKRSTAAVSQTTENSNRECTARLQDMTVTATWAKDVLPDAATMEVREVSRLEMITTGSARFIKKDLGPSQSSASKSFDIAFHNADGAEIEPSGNVQVSVTFDEPLGQKVAGGSFEVVDESGNVVKTYGASSDSSSDWHVLHVSEKNGRPAGAEDLTNKKDTKIVEASGAVTSVSFTSNAFSTFVIGDGSEQSGEAAILKEAIENSGNSGKTIKLTSDWTLPADDPYWFVCGNNENTNSLTLDLNGHTITRPDGSGARFVIKPNTTFTVTSSQNGGKVVNAGTNTDVLFEFNGGNLELSKVTFSGGTKAIVKMSGSAQSLTVANCTFENNGVKGTDWGPLFLQGGTAAITNSTFTNNKGYEGAAIYAKEGTLSVSGSIFEGNEVTNNGGAIWANAENVTLTGCTFTNNKALSADSAAGAGGALYYENGESKSLSITGGSFTSNTAHNGGAIYLSKATATIDSASLTNNTAEPFVGGSGEGGAIRAQDNSSLTLNSATLSNNAAKNGGAIFLNSGTLTATGGSISNNTTSQDNNDAGNPVGGAGGGINANGGAVTIEGTAVSDNSAEENGGGLYSNESVVTVKSGSVSQNTAAQNGGGIYAWNGKLDLTGGEISNNTATTDGGGVYLSYVNGGETTAAYGLTVSGGKITDNTATNGSGGGVYLTGNSGTHQAVISSGSVSGNTAGTNGGGIYVTSEQEKLVTLEVSGGTIANNEAANNGGGIAAAGKTTVTVKSGAAISGNHASNSVWAQGGGGIVAEGDSILLVKGGTIERNVSEGSGGGILFRGGTFKMTGGTVDSNVAKLHEGGGIAIISGMANIAGGRITNNASGYDENGNSVAAYQDWGGGGIFVSDQGGVLVMRKNTLVTSNTAGGFGGGVAACSTGRTYVLDTIAVYGNTADGEHLSGAGSVKHDDHQYAYDNETFMANGYQDYYSALFSYVTNTMPGGYEN